MVLLPGNRWHAALPTYTAGTAEAITVCILGQEQHQCLHALLTHFAHVWAQVHAFRKIAHEQPNLHKRSTPMRRGAVRRCSSFQAAHMLSRQSTLSSGLIRHPTATPTCTYTMQAQVSSWCSKHPPVSSQ